jgi:hypothetical protein
VTFRPKWFELKELVPPEIFRARGEAAWELLDARALMTLDAIREQFGPTIVNDWADNGRYRESGLRSAYSQTGAVYSQHRFGRAFDCKFREVVPGVVYEHILKHAEQFPHLTTLEDIAATTTWLHFDVRLNESAGIRIVKP